MARLSTATRHKVVILHQRGLSQTKISKQTGVSRCAVQALLKKHKETGNLDDRRRSGRPRKLSAADERHIMLTSLQNRKISSSAISTELAETSGTQVHPSTVRRSLARSGLHGRTVAKKACGQRGNKSKQGAEIWPQVLWTDNENEIEDGGEVYGSSEEEETERISDNEIEDGGEEYGSSEEETVRISGNEKQRIRNNVSGSAEGEENTQVSGTDTSPASAEVEDDVPASMNLLRPSNPTITRTRLKRISNRKERTMDLRLVHNRVLASPPTHSSSRAPTPGAAEHHIEVILCCEICGACFPTETDMESHQVQHLVKIMHECEKCSKAFQSAAGLKTHMKRKHGC